MNDFLNTDIASLSVQIKAKKLSPVELVRNLLDRIKKLNGEFHTYISISEKQAMIEAQKAELEIMKGLYRGPLHGIPISIKDNIHVKDTRITNGSIVHLGSPSYKDSSIVSQLRLKGAIILGKTNMDEIANNVTGINSNYGTVKNPLRANHTAGGSSGGSAASVAANFAYGSIGTDTSGSIRIPASCCGVFGLKPTYNLISTEGIIPLSTSLDHAGIIAKSCEDLSLLLQASLPGQGSFHDKEKNFRELKVGVLVDYDKDNDTEVQQTMDNIMTQFRSNKVEIKSVQTKFLEEFKKTHLTICSAEANYYYQQFIDNKEGQYEKGNEDFLEAGKTIPQSQYIAALNTKRMIESSFQNLFSDIDLIITPTLPILPPTLDSFKDSWEATLEKIIKYTGPFNMAGLPALTIPYNKNKQGLPIGIQLISDKFNEPLLFSIGNWLMKHNQK